MAQEGPPPGSQYPPGELVSTGQRLQKEGKVKWGYVGGMSMNNTWFSLWWSMWANNCDILKPLFELAADTTVEIEFAVSDEEAGRLLELASMAGAECIAYPTLQIDLAPQDHGCAYPL